LLRQNAMLAKKPSSFLLALSISDRCSARNTRLGAIAVFHRKAHAVERQADTAPGPVEILVHFQHRHIASRTIRACSGVCCLVSRSGRGSPRPKAQHQTMQHFGSSSGPTGAAATWSDPCPRGKDFHHAAVADVDLVPSWRCSMRVRNLSRSAWNTCCQAPCRSCGVSHPRDVGAVLRQSVSISRFRAIPG